MTNVSVEFGGGLNYYRAGIGEPQAGRWRESSPRLFAQDSQGARGKRACRGVNETYRYFGAGLLPQGRGLPMGLPGAHTRF